MILKSFAKINLGLRIGKLRPDGFHNLHMINMFLSLHDVIEMSVINEKKIIVSCDKDICNEKDNFAYKISKVFFELFNTNYGIKIHIKKNIPDGAGLAGGSSNASTALYGLNKLFNSNFSLDFMKSLSSKISSDSPMFFSHGIVECTGKGEITKTFENNFIKNCKILVKKGNEKTNTKKAYELFDKENNFDINNDRIKYLKESINTLDSNKISDNCFNDFERITKIEKGWHLTGSGSATFKLVDKNFGIKNYNIIECQQVKSGFEIIL